MMAASRRPSDMKPARVGRLARLPVFLALGGKRALVAGGSAPAAWKAELLAAAGAHVEVFSPRISDELVHLLADSPRKKIVWHRRDWRSDDLAGAAIAVGAFDDERSAAAFAGAARIHGVPVNVIDKPAHCDFAFGAIVNRSPLVIGISTDGAAPVFAQAIRARLEALLPKGFARWAQVAARWRSVVKAAGLSLAGRRRFWQLFAAHALANPDRDPTWAEFERLIAGVKEKGSAVEKGSVALVGAGPGDPELLTLRAVRALQAADVILFDDRVSHAVLDFARREARRIPVGEAGFGSAQRPADVGALIVGLAKQGERVVRLTGGDPLINGGAAEEIAACKAAGISVVVVRGVGAAQPADGAAKRLAPSQAAREELRIANYWH